MHGLEYFLFSFSLQQANWPFLVSNPGLWHLRLQFVLTKNKSAKTTEKKTTVFIEPNPTG